MANSIVLLVFCVCAADMVLKKSKHGLNTGNTLRRHVKCMLERCRHGMVQCRFDTDSVDSCIDRLYHSLFDSNSISIGGGGGGAEFELMLTLTKFMEYHSMYEMEDSSVAYSLSKLRRWTIIGSDFLLTCLNDICMVSTVPGVDVQLKVKENFGNWYSHEFVSVPQRDQLSTTQNKQQTRRKHLTRTHARGVQRKWKHGVVEHRNSPVVTQRIRESDEDSSGFDDDNDDDGDGLCPSDLKPTTR